MGYIAKIILGIVLLWCFAGVLSFLPYILGVFQKGFFLPVEIISQTIYPVGVFPYVAWIGGIGFFVGRFVYEIATKHT